MGNEELTVVFVIADYNDDRKVKDNKVETPKSQEEKRKHIKTLIDKIPTDKSSLFEYALDWSSVDNVSDRFTRRSISRECILRVFTYCRL